MLKEIFSQKLRTQSKTVHNAIITLGDTDDSGKGKTFKSRFLQPGLAGYPGQFGNALIRKENLDKFIHTLRTKPVIINHKDNITDEDKVGEVFNVWFNQADGWYWCDGVITDETAQNLITDKGWSVSCSYDFTKYDDEGGTENNIPYDIEFLDGVFTHLAIVNNPRYERANIVFNSKTVVQNGGKGSGHFDHDGRDGQVGGSLPAFNHKETDLYKNLPKILKDAVDFALESEPVGELIGTEFQKDNVKITDKVLDYYTKEYNNKVVNAELGEVKLDKEAIKDSLGHGLGREKAAAYKIVPKIIEKGFIFDRQTNWKGRGYDTAVLIAPFKMNKKHYVGEVVIKQGKERQGFYLHEINIKKEFTDVFKTANGSTPTNSKLIIAKLISTFNPTEQEMLNNVENDKWITIHPNGEDSKGRPLLLKDGETPKEAIERTYKKGNAEYKKSETWEQAEDFARKNGIKIAKYDDFSPEIADAINKAILTLPVEDRPDYITSFKEIERRGVLRGDMLQRARKSFGLSWNYPETIKDKNNDWISTEKQVYFNSKYKKLDQIEKRKKDYNQNNPSGKPWYFNTKGESTFYHELGHQIQDKYISDKEFQELADKWADSSEHGNIKKREWGETKAGANYKEAFAEAWAGYHVNNPELPKEIHEYIKKIKQSTIKNNNAKEQEMLNNVENWNEADHPRDETGKFTEKGGKATKKGKLNTYKQSLLKETKSIIKDIEDEILTITKTNDNILALENLDEWDLKAVERNLSKAEELEKQIKYYKENLTEILQMPNTVDNAKEHEMALIEELKKLITKVENDKGENMDDEKKVENEKVDKRKLIDEVGGILKGKVDEEVWRTIIGKIEKVAYDKSEAGTADNEKEEDKKDEEKAEELKKEVKEDVENKKGCDNSVDNAKPNYFDKLNEVYNSAVQVKEENVYISRDDKLKAADEYFSK